VEEKAEKKRWSPVKIKTILVPTDLRPESTIALRYGLTLAKQFGASLTLLHVMAEPPTAERALAPGEEKLLQLNEGAEEQALALLEEELRSEQVDCQSSIRVGAPFEQIVEEAQSIEANLIVMSSHGYGWLGRFVHGSAAEMILHNATCPDAERME
jgi:nucleotide-binding universal stress UspA family protein